MSNEFLFTISDQIYILHLLSSNRGIGVGIRRRVVNVAVPHRVLSWTQLDLLLDLLLDALVVRRVIRRAVVRQTSGRPRILQRVLPNAASLVDIRQASRLFLLPRLLIRIDLLLISRLLLRLGGFSVLFRLRNDVVNLRDGCARILFVRGESWRTLGRSCRLGRGRCSSLIR